MAGTDDGHLHLAWYGYEQCKNAGCTRPRADPADDMTCTDLSCGGGCEAARHNARRRMGLFPPGDEMIRRAS